MLSGSLAEVSRLEEARQALGTAEIATVAEPIAGGFMCFSGEGSWSNQACGLGLHGPVSDADLDALVRFYESRGVEPKLEVSPFAHETLVDGLARRGFLLREFENVMAREISPGEDLKSLLSDGVPSELQIEHVMPDDEPRVRSFIEVSTSGFRDPGKPIAEVFYTVTERMVKHPRCDSFSASLEGRLVGGGAMESAGEVACLFGTSVLPEARRRGVQAALMVRRLMRASERGCRIATIHSKPGIPTERNAARLGFVLAYTKVVMARPGEGLTRSP